MTVKIDDDLELLTTPLASMNKPSRSKVKFVKGLPMRQAESKFKITHHWGYSSKSHVEGWQ